MPQVEITVVAPIYRGEAFVEELTTRLAAALLAVSEHYEVLLVDDGSTDGAWSKICAAGKTNERIRGIRLSRNFGQHPAITAGIDHARGEWIVVMDGDLQDRPEDIPELYKKAVAEGFDMVIARRARQDITISKRLFSIIFYRTLSWLGGIENNQKIGNYRIFSRKVADAFKLYREQFRLFPALMTRVGFRTGFLDVDREAQPQGRSTYSLGMLFRLATDIIIANSEKPLWLGIYVGSMVSVVAFALAIWTAARAALFGIEVSGWASLFVALTFFSGVQLMVTGLLGIYIGRVFNETKQRPLYIIAEGMNVDMPPSGRQER